MATPRFEYHPEAVAEARAAYYWYAEASEEVADRFWQELVEARRRVCQHPAAWTPYYHGTRCFLLRRFPYGLVYTEHDGKIIGLAVCHLHRRPGYWQDRLS